MGDPLGMYQAAQQAQPTSEQMDIYNRNAPYVAQGAPITFNTSLPPLQEMQFRDWLTQNKVPFDPSGSPQDYDMRGFYAGLQSGHPQAMTAVNQNDKQLHYPDYWKTPLHESFSAESQWAGPNAPKWNDKDQLVTPDGRIVFDERKRK
jgi:hypothetical protein